jgi:microcystin-dependent protein
MATTTNYSWTTPDDTALVKDGAAAIRSLGTAIDTTVFNTASAGIAKTIVDAKGDIIAATAADTVARLAVGANDTVLTADSSTATGLKWAAPSGTSVGTVIFHAKNTAPSGFLKCNGAAISRTTYSALFTEIGTTFGVGDGSTTFNVPDLRGYFPRGWADDGSIDSGRTFGTTQQATTFASRTDGNTVPIGGFQNSDGTNGTDTNRSASSSEFVGATYQKVRPVNIALLAAIKF